MHGRIALDRIALDLTQGINLAGLHTSDDST
jgi:hypothetical protein